MRKVLILGKSANAFALAKLLSKNAEVYVSPGNVAMSEFVTLVDSDNYDVAKIIEFVMEQDISLTIPVDLSSVSEDLIRRFESNNLQLFVPNFDFASLIRDKLAVKKFLYMLRIQTPRFASFEKVSVAYDYVKNLRNPIIIKSNLGEYATVCVNERIAKTAIDDLSLRDENILIEEFIQGQTFSIYFLSDGYKVLPLGTSQNYNFSLEGDGGILTNGVGALSPYYKLTEGHIEYLTSSVAGSIINHYEQQGQPLMGILGIEVILTPDDRLYVSNIKHFISDSDCQGILALLDIDLLKVIDDCLMGVFADLYDYIPQKDSYALSAVISSRKEHEVIEGLKNLDEEALLSFYNVQKNKYLEYETVKGKNLNLTTIAGTISRAREALYQEIDEIKFDTKVYRKDIGSIISGNRGLL